LVAIALLEADAVRWWRPRAVPRAAGVAALGLGGAAVAVLLTAMVANDAAAIAYRAGLDAGSRGDWEVATERFQRAVALDPWHPAGPRALTVAADAAGQPELALEAARNATLVNPGDATAWTNLALTCGGVEDLACQEAAAREAVATARYLAPELLNAALVLEALGETDAADDAFRLSLLTQPITSFVVDWPRAVPIGDGTLPDVTDPSWELNLLLARHDMGEPLAAGDYTDPAVRALAHALEGERAEAREWIGRGIAEHSDDIRTWDIAIVLRSAWGEDVSREIAIASVLRGGRYPARDLRLGVPRRTFDVASFRGYPLDGFVSDATRLYTRPPFPWALERLLPSEDPRAAGAG
jgi:tetratricopeptide (TPR) repeat protein